MDYTYPSVYFAYSVFFLFMGVAIYFFARSFGDGYWGAHSEDAKYRMLHDEEAEQNGCEQ